MSLAGRRIFQIHSSKVAVVKLERVGRTLLLPPGCHYRAKMISTKQC